MSTTLDLPGGSATIRDPKLVTERQRRPVKDVRERLSVVTPDVSGMTPGDAALTIARSLMERGDHLEDGYADVCILALVADWTYDAELTADGLLDIPAAAYDALKLHCVPLAQDMFPSFTPKTDENGRLDPETPTQP